MAGFLYKIALKMEGQSGLAKAAAMSERFDSQLGRISQKLDNIGGELARVGRVGQSAFGGMTNSLRGFVGAFAGIEAGKSILRLTADMEQTNIAFETFLKDGNLAKKTISDLSKFSDITPFDDKEVFAAARSILAVDRNTSKLIPNLSMLGNLASGTNSDFSELAREYSKLQMGKIQNDDLNKFLERGINLMPEFQKMFGKSKIAIYEMFEDNLVTFKQFDAALTNVSNKEFGGLMIKQSQSLSGQWSTLLSQIQRIGLDIGNSLLPAFKSLVSDYFMPAATFIKEHIGLLTTLAGVVSGAYASYKLATFGLAAWSMTTTAMNFLIPILTGEVTLLNAAMNLNPAVRLATFIFAVGGAVIWAWNKFDGFRASLTGFGYAIWDTGKSILKFLFTPLKAVAGLLYGIVSGDFSILKESIIDASKAITAGYDAGISAAKSFNKGYDSVMSKADPMGSFFDIPQKNVTSSFLKDGGASTTTAPDAATKKGMDNITGGGNQSRNVTISINTVKVSDQMTIQNDATQSAPTQLTDEILKKLIQIINSSQSVQLG